MNLYEQLKNHARFPREKDADMPWYAKDFKWKAEAHNKCHQEFIEFLKTVSAEGIYSQ